MLEWYGIPKEVATLLNKTIEGGNEIMFHFPMVSKYSYANVVEYNKDNDSVFYDTIPTFLIQFKNGYKTSYRKQLLSKTEEWLQVRMANPKIETVEY